MRQRFCQSKIFGEAIRDIVSSSPILYNLLITLHTTFIVVCKVMRRLYSMGEEDTISRIASPKILLWQKRCLMRESYQPLLWETQAAGRKRGYDEYDKPE